MQIDINSDIQIIKELISPNKKIVITSHHNPDGDAIGSMLGLYNAFLAMGIKADLVIPNDIPDFLSWMPGSENLVKFSKNKDSAASLLCNADVIFALDYNGASRLEAMANDFTSAKGVKVLIDHHPNPEKGFSHYISDTSVSSTAELVFEFIEKFCGVDFITIDSAICLFTGIMTDTGSFSYACSSPRTFEISAKLITKGVKVENIQEKVYNNFSDDRMRLLGYSISSKMKVYPEYRSAFISLTSDELKRYNYKIGDTEGLVNYPLSIKGIVFSALLVENTNHVKISLRSRGSFPVNKISEQYFNGGGHLNAAGGKSFVSLTETEKIFGEIYKNHQTQLKG
jgi:bifunctional oligoribonuclease and PAP phosphatase NrnA